MKHKCLKHSLVSKVHLFQRRHLNTWFFLFAPNALTDTRPSALLSQDLLPSEEVSYLCSAELLAQDVPGPHLADGSPGTFFFVMDFQLKVPDVL